MYLENIIPASENRSGHVKVLSPLARAGNKKKKKKKKNKQNKKRLNADTVVVV